MEIIKISAYKDGGTVKIITTDEIYYIDSRIGTKTKGSLFLGYPKDDNSNIISKQDDIKLEIIESIKNYNELEFGGFDWKPQIYELLNIKYE